MKIHIVIERGKDGGTDLCYFAHAEDAHDFALALKSVRSPYSGTKYDVVVSERTLWYGQPPIPGFNL